MPRSQGWGAPRSGRSLHANAIGDIVDDLLREPQFEPGVAGGRPAGAWGAIVGPRLASETTPERPEAAIGRAAGRARGENVVVAGSLKKKQRHTHPVQGT